MKLLKVPQVASLLSCSIATVYALIDNGQLTAIKIGAKGGGVRVSEDDLTAFIDSRRTQPVEKKQASRQTIKLKHLRL